MNKLRSNLEQNLGWVALLVLGIGCLAVLRPFVSALLWAVVLCFSSWPLYQRLLRLLGNRATLAATLMTLVMVLVLLLPFVLIGTTLGNSIKDLTLATRNWIQDGPPHPPAWLARVPGVGATAVDYWQSLAQDTARLWAQAQRFIEPASAWLIRAGLALGGGLLELALSIFIAFFLFRDGVSLARRLAAAIGRIGGERGYYLLGVAGQTVRGVVYGILGTALAQAIMAGLGYLLAGLPGPGLLALLTFFLSVVPVLGTSLVWGPAAFWLFNQGSTGWAIFMIIWGLGVASLDNFIKPWLISQGSNLPFILIFFGVLGGALAFGFIGVFLGPTLLAVGYRLVEEWSAGAREATAGGETPRPE